MQTKAIKISEENYRWLSMIAGKMQMELGEPVSIDQALSSLKLKSNLSESLGKWKMDEKEAAEINKSIRGLRKWKRSV